MPQPIYRFFRSRFKSEWHRLPREEQDRRLSEMSAAWQRSGITNPLDGLVHTCCSSEWTVFGVEVFESLEAVQEWREEMERMGWFDYIEQENMIGIQRD